MNPLRFVRHAATVAFAAGLLALGATDAHATHFRYGTIKWHIINQGATTYSLEVTAECAWRRSFYNPQPNPGQLSFATGQNLVVQATAGGSYNQTQALAVDVTNVFAAEDWWVGSKTFTYNNIPNAATLRIFWNGNARISTLMDGNNDQFFNVEARLTPDPTNLFSPASSLLPIISIAHGQPAAHFFIPANDPENDTLTWSISTTARSSLVKAAPDGFPDTGIPTLSIDANTGLVTWNTAAEQPPGAGHELYAVQFLVKDSKGAEIPVDALLKLVPNTSQPPRALVNGQPTAQTFNVNPNQLATFVFTGTDPDVTDTVTLNSGATPLGSHFTPNLPFTGVQPQSSTFTWTPTLADIGSHVISLSVTDNFALQGTNSATIVVLPNFPPSLTCPGPLTKEATGALTDATVSSTVQDPDGDALTARWYADGALAQTVNIPANSGAVTLDFLHSYSLGGHPVRLEINDGFFPTVFCNTSVVIQDTTPPIIDTPPSQLLEATSAAGAQATWSPDPPHAHDIVDGDLLATCNHASGETFPIGPGAVTNTVVNCSAHDNSNNTATASFTIGVQDTTPPTVVVPANITVEAAGPGGTIVTFSVTAHDIVDGNLVPACNAGSGQMYALGTTTVACPVTDAHGNTGTASFNITVQDTIAPTVTVPPDMVREATGPAGANVTFVPAPTAFDIVSGNLIPTCTPASGSLFHLNPPPPPTTTTTVVCTATDGAGNTGSASFHVTIQDTTPPAITNVPADITVPSSMPGGGAVVTWPPLVGFDIVDLGVPVTCVPPSGSVFNVGTTTVSCSAHDVRNNTSHASFHVTVLAPPPVPCVTLDPGELWPPNHKMRDIAVTAIVPGQGGATCNITSVTSTEPVTGRTYGDFAPDWIFSGLNLQLRSERYDKPGRTYSVTVTCTANGQTGNTVAHLLVPHDQSDHEPNPIHTCN